MYRLTAPCWHSTPTLRASPSASGHARNGHELSPSAVEHAREHGLDRVNDAQHVDSKGLLHVGDVQRREPCRHSEARIGDDDIDGTKSALNLLDRGMKRLAIAHIGGAA